MSDVKPASSVSHLSEPGDGKQQGETQLRDFTTCFSDTKE